MTVYPTADSAGRLRIRRQSLGSLSENQPSDGSRLYYGTVMHKILQEIICKSDQENAIRKYLNSGFISTEESGLIRSELEEFWKMPETSDWFDPDAKILNETTILTPQGSLYRPDRVVVRGNTAAVIDYKFGRRESESSISQVRRYAELLSEMGYEAKGFVCYVSLRKTAEV